MAGSRGPVRWREREAAPALRAAKLAGVEVERIEMSTDGKISIYPKGAKKSHKPTNGTKPLRKSPFPYAKPVRHNGKTYWYFSRAGQALGRLPGAWGSAEFQEA